MGDLNSLLLADVNNNGLILLEEENTDLIQSFLHSLGTYYKNNNYKVMVASQTDHPKAKQWCDLISRHALCWVKSITWIKDPIAQPVMCSFLATNKTFNLGLFILVDDDAQNRCYLQCLNSNGFAFQKIQIQNLFDHECGHESQMMNKMNISNNNNSSTLKKCSDTIVYATLANTFSEIIMRSTIDVIECSNLKFAFLINSKSIQQYIKHCANLFSLKYEFICVSDGWPWPSEEAKRDQEMHDRLSDYRQQHAVQHQANVIFCITDDGQQMAAGVTTDNENHELFILSDQDVVILLVWWTNTRLQSELEYAIFRTVCPLEIDESGEQDVCSMLDARTKVGLVCDESATLNLFNNNIITTDSDEKDNLLELIKVGRDTEDNIVGVVGQKIKHTANNNDDATSVKWHNKFSLGWDGHRRYLCGTRAWDAVAASIQLAHIAIFARAISRCNLQQLLTLLKMGRK